MIWEKCYNKLDLRHYIGTMEFMSDRTKLIKQLSQLGFVRKDKNGKHMVYEKGSCIIPVPNHNKISKFTVKALLKRAKNV